MTRQHISAVQLILLKALDPGLLLIPRHLLLIQLTVRHYKNVDKMYTYIYIINLDINVYINLHYKCIYVEIEIS